MREGRLLGTVLAAVVLLAGCPSSPRFGSLRFGPRSFELDVDVTVVELRSGLVIALLPDPRTNLVSVDVRYKVGAAEDPEGRGGMAHLVEHLTFELRPSAGAPPLEAVLADAALVYNAYTSHDQTHFWSVGLADRLDDLLELEARRMDPRCEQLDEAVFLRERDVVLEEHAQRGALTRGADGQARAIWGADHPYAREIGAREIADVTREEACRFLDDHYAPNRAILVVAGNFDADALAPRLTERFGGIARRSEGTRTAIAPPVLDGGYSEHTIASTHPRIVVSFAAPPSWSAEVAHEVAADYLPGVLRRVRGKKGWFVPVQVSSSGGAGGGLFEVTVIVKGEEHVDEAIALVYKAADTLAHRWELQGFEANRAKRRTRILDRLDGFWTRGHWIADRLQYAPGEELFASTIARIDRHEVRDVRDWAAKNLVRTRSHVAVLKPAEDTPPPPRTRIASSETDHDLAPDSLPVDPAEADRGLSVPTVGAPAIVEDYQLDNGLRVVLAPVAGARMVDARLVFPIGNDARETADRKLAWEAARSLHDDLTPDFVRYDLERLDWIFGLGTLLDADVDGSWTRFRARGMSLFADWHLWRLFWRIDAGIYPPDPKKRRKESRVPDGDGELRDLLERMKASHDGVVHIALWGSAFNQMDDLLDFEPSPRAQLVDFRERFYTPRGATLIVAGGFDATEVQREIEELFGTWRDREPAATPARAAVNPPDAPRWVAIQDPDARQVRITVAVGGLPRGDAAARAVLREMMRDRLDQVRDGQGASYGIHSGYLRRGDVAALLIDGHVDPLRAGKSLATIVDAVAELRDDTANQAADFVRARRRALARALARAGSPGDVANELEAAITDARPLDALDRHAAEIAALTRTDLGAIAARDLATGTTVIVVSGPESTARTLLEGAGVAPGDITDHEVR